MQEFKSLLEVYDNVVFFDTETTGLDPTRNEIIEIAAVSYTKKSIAEIDHFVIPNKVVRLPQEIVKLTGITDEMVASEGLTQDEAGETFARFIGGKKVLLVAHNANFDLGFVRYWLKGREIPEEIEFLDTLTVYKDRRPYPHKLKNAIDAYKLSGKVQNTHRAIDDVRALVEVTKAMAAERDDLMRYINLFGFNPKYGLPWPTVAGVMYRPQPFRSVMASPKSALYAFE